jgi:putative transposase
MAPEWNRALAPVYGKTAAQCRFEVRLELSPHVLRHHEDQHGTRLLQSERNAMLFIDVLRSYVAAGKFKVHDFVVMPNHVHLLLTVGKEMTVERAMQFIKGGFSYRLKKEFGYPGEVWQRGYSELRVEDESSFQRHREYIAENPVKAGLANGPGEFPYCFAYLARQNPQGLKPPNKSGFLARLKSCPDTKRAWRVSWVSRCSRPGNL